VQLSTGRYDALSGCFLDIGADLDALVSQADAIRSGELYTLRVQALDASPRQTLR
jgi:hypothetical protein